MYIITLKIRRQSGHFLSQLTCGSHRDLSVVFALPHFNSSKAVPTTAVSLCFFAGCTPMFSGHKDNMPGRLRTMTTTM